MLNKILGTVGTRYLVAGLNLILIFINAKTLGLEGVGLAGLIVASANIAMVVNGIFAGNTIVYFMNQYSVRQLIVPAYIWSFVGGLLACTIMLIFGMLPKGWFLEIYLLSVVMSLVNVNARFLLGKDRITNFNLTFFIQGGLLLFVLLYIYFVLKKNSVDAYVAGMFFTNIAALIVSLLMIINYLRGEKEETDWVSMLRKMFSYGLWGSSDNVAEILTTRLNYFLVQHFTGLAGVGLLDAGTKISESVWHISRSVSFIEYEQVARAEERAQKQITLQLLKLTFFTIAFATFIILLIPEKVYTDFLFSPQFQGMRQVIIFLALGIIALGTNSLLSSFFTGTGRIKISAFSSFIGLVTLLIAGYIIVPRLGVKGAAISCSIAYCCMLVFSIIMFCKETRSNFKELIPNNDDREKMKELIHRFFAHFS